MALRGRDGTVTSLRAVDSSPEAATSDDALRRENELLRRANAELERSHDAVWRENARLARSRMVRTDAAAATELTRTARRAAAAEARCAQLEAEVERLSLESRLLATPRHQALERARERAMRWRPVYWIVRRSWALVARSR